MEDEDLSNKAGEKSDNPTGMKNNFRKEEGNFVWKENTIPTPLGLEEGEINDKRGDETYIGGRRIKSEIHKLDSHEDKSVPLPYTLKPLN